MTISEFFPLQKELVDIQNHGLRLVQSMQYGCSQPIEIEQWLLKTSSYCNRYLQDYPYYNMILTIIQSAGNAIIDVQFMNRLLAFLDGILKDNSYWMMKPANTNPESKQYFQQAAKSVDYPGRNLADQKAKVFVVHGHDDATRHEVARLIEKMGFEAVVLREQPDGWRTIMEKFQQNAFHASFAVVLYTECDIGRAKEVNQANEKYRARQNVIFEHGYFLGLLGRERVCALIKGNIEIPSDLNSVGYTRIDPGGGWKLSLANIMNQAGLDIDMNKLLC